ncbi:hypothetical protein DH2020_022192 [Rehmannia glutinosa]|uniref:CCHC-type domain-containing protein n=1 Tax=Rehmannia glutinosa TaxID=99300 RepID=A0ABR0WD51_REHGL
MNRKALETIGKKIGRILDIDEGESGNFWGRFARIRVQLHIDNPLKKFVSVQAGEEAEDIIILLVYKRLLDYCFACGRIGHTHKECTDENADKENLQFGQWMKAASHTDSRKSSKEPLKGTRSPPSGASSSNRALSISRSEGGNDSKGKYGQTPEAEKIVSSDTGAETNLKIVKIGEERATQRNEKDKQIMAERSLKTPIKGWTNTGVEDQKALVNLGALTQTKEIQLVPQCQEEGGSKSNETNISTGRSPQKWKKRARAKKIVQRDRKPEQLGICNKKRRADETLDMDISPKKLSLQFLDDIEDTIAQTAVVASQSRRAQ